MESRAPAVVAVIVTTGSGPGLEAAAASLAAQNYEQLSLLVVANGDAALVAERVASVAPHAFVRVLEDNRGFGAACNEAALMVEGSAFFLFCHDDVRLAHDAVQLMVEAAYRTNAGIVTPKVVEYEDPITLLHVGQSSDRFGVVRERIEPGEIDHGQQDLERDVFVAPGGVTLVRADLFASLHGFDPLISLLGEDLDLCWRAQVAGARIVVAPLATVAHRQTILTGERSSTASGARRASRQDLQRRHQLLVVASGWRRRTAWWTLLVLAVLDVLELGVALIGADTDRAGAILSSWRWLFKHRHRVRQRRRQIDATRVLSDVQLHRLQEGGVTRARHFLVTLARHGYDRARGILPVEALGDEEVLSDSEAAGVGFAAAFSEAEEFDEIANSEAFEVRTRPSHVMTSFRAQATLIVVAAILWFVGSRNLLSMQLPLIGRLAPLDSWWSTWRHFFASWSTQGVGSGAPGMPGYGLLAFAGTFVIGRMGILVRLALVLGVPLGALGMARLLKDRTSNRARLIGALVYAAMPVGMNAIGQGRLDVIISVASLPFIVRRIFEVMDVPGFRRRPYGPAVPFGQRGWRVSEAGQRMSLIMIVAAATALAPACLVASALVVVGVALSRVFEPDPENQFRGPARFLGSLVFNVAVFLVPMTIDVAAAGRRSIEVFGLPRGPWSVPTFLSLLRDADGSFGSSWWGWLLPVAALFALILCRGDRRRVATKLATIAALTLILVTLASRHWLGSFSPDLDVLLALYAVTLAAMIGLGVGALEHDLRGEGFGWRQICAVASVLILAVASLPFLESLGSGRFDLPTTSIASSLGTLAPSSAGGYRVLWLGDPSVVPLPGWTVEPGLEAATSTNGLPGGATLFSSPDAGAADLIMKAVSEALSGRTVRLGALLAPAGISTIVVMNSAAPEIAGVQSVPERDAPGVLASALNDQSDLSLELQSSAVDVFSNSLFRGVTAVVSPGSSALSPLFSTTSNTAVVLSGSTVRSGLAPASAFALDVDGAAAPHSTEGSWLSYFRVPTSAHPQSATLVLQRFPLDGILAGFTLAMWLLVWLGFGWIQRLEWLVTGRRRRAAPREDR
ncbi:MAG TPA: glycosyltransferase family 2 protein [Acidimicrobiales bacterium]